MGVALLLHALFFVSLITGWLDPLFVEASQGFGQGSDFFGIYQAGANLLDGYSIYDSADYRNEAPQVVPVYYFYRYLPPTAYGAALLTRLLPPGPAYWLWVILNELLILILVAAVVRNRNWPANRRWLIAALWLGFFPLYIEQFMGQFSITMALLLWLTWRSDERAVEPRTAGRRPHGVSRIGWIAWGLSLTLKSFSGFLILPYLRDARCKRILAGIGLALLLCLPYLLARPADVLEFARLNFSPFSPQIYKGSFGLQNALRDLLSNFPAAAETSVLTIAGRTLHVEGMLLLGLSLLIFAAALRATVQLGRHPRRHAFDLALWITVFFLVFKSVWEYHYVMMLPALTAAYLVSGSRTVLVLGVLMGLPTLFAAAPLAGVDPGAPLGSWPAWFRSLHFSVKAIPTLLFFGWCLREAQRIRGAHADLPPGPAPHGRLRGSANDDGE